MEPITTALAVLAGMLLRFGLPLLAMAAVVYFLRRLDKRWQEEGRQRMANMVMLSPQTPCWEVHNCQNKEQCLAYANPGIPCWQQFRSEEGMLKENCLGCSVFRNAPVPVKA